MIEILINWITTNKSWFFSGLGIAFSGVILGLIKWVLIRKKNDKIGTIDVAKNRSVILKGKIKGSINTGDNKK